MSVLLNHSHRELMVSTSVEDRSDPRLWRINTNVTDLASHDPSCSWNYWILSFRVFPIPAKESILLVLPLRAIRSGTSEEETWRTDMLELFDVFRLPSLKGYEFYQSIRSLANSEAELRIGRGKFMVEVEVSYVPTDLVAEIEPSRPAVPGLSKDLILRLLKHARRDSNVVSTGVVHTCSVCQEDIAGDREPIMMPCKHVFCCQCITRWLERSNTCPECRCIYADIGC